MTDYGYARVATLEQDAQLQLDALAVAGYRQKTGSLSSARGQRPARAPAAIARTARCTGTGGRPARTRNLSRRVDSAA